MKWEGREESENVEDARGQSAKPMMVAGGGALTVVIALVIMFMRGDPRAFLAQANQGGQVAIPGAGGGGAARAADPAEERLASMVKVVLKDTEDVWTKLFRESGKVYEKPTLKLFTGEVQSACGFASAASGPFYCPGDRKVYIDLAFCQELSDKFKAPGDFAVAYVLAHEVGHHVQHQLGYTDRVHGQRKRISEAEYNKLSVRLELQADFLAGCWAHHAQQMKNILESGDVEEALRAAAAVGDDRIQKAARGYVVPESFTHGTAKQRMRWFAEGLKTGKVARMTELFELSYEQL
jgi:hypothetical protein